MSVNAVLNTDDIIAANKSPVSATGAEMRCLPSEAYNISDMPRDDHSVSYMPIEMAISSLVICLEMAIVMMAD